MINGAFGLFDMCTNEETFILSFEHTDEVEKCVLESQHRINIMAKELFDLFKDGEQLLYDECIRYSKLSFFGEIISSVKVFLSN